ncbi:MAG: polysaccharide deacetylase family protein [Firmicutes bacterium]|nr:polysaccharide deacetylase family protein [Bacillota bacterium]
MKKFFIPLVILVLLGLAAAKGLHLTRFWTVQPHESVSSASDAPKDSSKDSAKVIVKDTAKEATQPAVSSSPIPNPVSVDKIVPNDLPPEKQDRTVYSWWFKRSSGNLPPEFDQDIVKMVRGKALYLGNTSEKMVYLTFDEGYENSYTPQILDTLKTNGIPAAFFVTADYVYKQPELVKKIAADGYIVGNHTSTHPSLPKLADSEIRKEIVTTHEKVRELTGIDMKFMRPPMGEYNSRVLNEINELGYKTVFWSLAYRDWEVDKQPGREAALSAVMDNLHPGAVILLHAVSQSNTEALDDIIKGIKAKGYSFAALNQLKQDQQT